MLLFLNATNEYARTAKDLPLPKKIKKMIVRSSIATIMFTAAYLIFASGHMAVACVLFGLQVMVFREFLGVRYELSREKNIPRFRTIVWMWFAVACFYFHGSNVDMPFRDLSFFRHPFTILSKKFGFHQIQEWLSFSLYVSTFCLTVLSLKKGMFEYQMQQLAWTGLTIAVVTAQSQAAILNVYNGLFWVVFPGMLVIINDVMAYFCGFSLGRKLYKGPFLPDLSPNKTWEGFIGAGIFTVVAGFFLPKLMASRYMACPYADWAAQGEECAIPEVFIARELPLWPISGLFLGDDAAPIVTASTMQIHGIFLAMFASAIAPFGGFFASAIKRAYGVKDFGDLFPGHGGFTDRLDCQFIMALCTNVHYHTFIAPRALSLYALLMGVQALGNQRDLQIVLDALNKRMADVADSTG